MEIINSGDAMLALNRSEIDSQVATAKAYPRSIENFHREAIRFATINEEIAASCFYALPRYDKKAGRQIFIEGKSVRMAEIVAHCWGNLRADTRIVGIDATHVTAQSMAFDCERNVAIRSEKKAKIVDKDGRRFSEDLITMHANACASKAFRDAIFDIVPEALLLPIVEAAKKVIRGDEKSYFQRVQNAIKLFEGMGKSEKEVVEFLGKKGRGDIDQDDLLILRGIIQAIKEGELTNENCLNKQEAPKSNANIDAIKDRLRANNSAIVPEVEPEEPAPAKRGRPRKEVVEVEAVQKPYVIQGERSIFSGRTLAELGGKAELQTILDNEDLQEGLTESDLAEITRMANN